MKAAQKSGRVTAMPNAASGAESTLSDRRERTRQRIFAATFRLIGHEKGLSVRIEEICVEASISRGTFYNYFSSMEELFETLAVELTHDFNQAVIAACAAIEGVAERTSAVLRHYLKRANRDPAWAWAMVHLSASGPIFGAESFRACAGTIAEGIANGEFDVASAETGRDAVMGVVLASMRSQLQGQGGRTRPEDVAHLLLRALGVLNARASAIARRQLPRIGD